jgi:Flp pilus assembly protein TadB
MPRRRGAGSLLENIMLKLLLAALALLAIALIVTPPSLIAIPILLAVAALPFLFLTPERNRLARRLDRLLATIAAALGLSALAACNDKPHVEPTPPVHVEPCQHGTPECTWPDGQPK